MSHAPCVIASKAGKNCERLAFRFPGATSTLRASSSNILSHEFALHCCCFDAIRFQVVKQLAAILFSVMLVWMQIAPTPSVASPVCMMAKTDNCADCCSRMACCATKPTSNSQPAPAVPTQSNAQNQISLLAPAMVAWILPQNSASLTSSVPASPLLAISAPLYARNCSLLL